MSESTLSIAWEDLKKEVGAYLGYGRTISDWSATQVIEIEAAVQSGVRRVYYPSAIDKGVIGHEWSWLRPTKSLSLSADDWDYDLPDDFGRLIGNIHHAADEYRPAIVVVSEAAILDMRARGTSTDTPKYVAVRPKSSTGSTGQRWEAVFFPTPEASYTLSYSYEAYSGKLTDSLPYPLGGMQLAELYIESCLAVAEHRINDEIGIHAAAYQPLLLDAVMRDRRRGAKVYGQMGHREGAGREWRRGMELYDGAYSILYGGNQI